MAQPAKDELASSSAQAVAPAATSNPRGGLKAASRAGTPASRMSPGLTPISFQAVNSRAASEHARVDSPATAASLPRARLSDRAPPASETAVAPTALASGQISTSTSTLTSQPAKPSSLVDNSDSTTPDTSYGTRSRNRTNARPNYAEDQDVDFDFSSAATTAVAAAAASATTTTTSKKKAMDAAAGAGNGPAEPKQIASFTAVNGGASAHAKDSASSNSGTATGTSKKRKAGGGAPASALSTAAAAATAAPPSAAARKQNGSASSTTTREINVMTFTKHRNCLNKKGELVADDGTKLCVNDHVYLVCEPPGDPYYLCRIMEFLHSEPDNPDSPVDSLRVNWYYRPRDVARFSSDTRLVFGTMHSDMCPLTSLRGKCTIKHRSEIDDLDLYRKERDSFYFVQAFDRFIRRSYECIPVKQIINVPEKVKKALDERWKFVVVEIGRVKELTSEAKTCRRCARYCASSDSVDCALCYNSYHMNCVQPPLPKKPSRGFAWACGPCSRATERQKEARQKQSRQIEARSTPTASGNGTEEDEDEPVEDEDAPAGSNETTRAPSPTASDIVIDDHPATQAEIALAKMWPMRYLGIHARVEDALQYDDRAIYPRASSRLGPRHQANVNMWHGRPVELVKPAEIKKRYNKGPAGKKESKLTKETLAAMEAEREEKAKRPKWVQDEPVGYVPRGEDYPANDPRCTAKLMFKMPSVEEQPGAAAEDAQDAVVRHGKFMDSYVTRAKSLARQVGVPPFGTNFMDKALELLTANKYNVDVALKQLQKVDRRADLHEPVFSKSDLVKFEEGVAKYGSEHRLVRLHMKTNLPHADIVRFYYLWKKTPKGREIWGNYGGRKKRKVESDAGAKLQAEVAHDVDDSAFDNDKAVRKNRGFQCKFCNSQYSRQWRRAPGVAPGQMAPVDGKATAKEKKERPLLALCLRCAGLWRKYAIQWEEIDEGSKKAATGGGRGVKRKIDEELLREIIAANEAASMPPQEQAAAALPAVEGVEPPKKKSKVDKDGAQAAVAAVAATKKEKPPPPPKEPTPPPPPIIPAQPTWKVLPCAICRAAGDTIACAHCKLTVHRRCFGVGDTEGVRVNGEVNWICEQCQNDRNPSVSTDYSCCLCLTEETLVDLVEPPKVSHKKKTDREREKERLEKELADNMRAEYRSKQMLMNRPVFPREPLKRTTGNNWVHVYCALWAPEIRFSDAEKLEVAEGFQLIPQARFEAVCKLCKNKDHQNRVRENAGACVNCHHCNAAFHASCAFEAGYTFGFDVQPVKGSRKDQITTATLGQETGALTAVILCKEHVVKTIVHPIEEIADESGNNCLQVYAENYKQADLALTGTVRKAAQAQLTKDKAQLVSAQNGARRESGAHSIAAAVRRGARTSSIAEPKAEGDDGSTEISNVPEAPTERRCFKCNIDVTPKWHRVTRGSLEDHPKTPPRGFLSDGEANKPQEGSDANSNGTLEPPRQQNIRFMAPGASGRAWEGMPERYGLRTTPNGERPSGDSAIGAPVGPRDPALPPSEMNGEHGPTPEDAHARDNDDSYRNHAPPPHRNAGPRSSPLVLHKFMDDLAKDFHEWLCHKCFMKKKLDPTPPPEERSERMPISSPNQYPTIRDGHSRSSQPPGQLTIEEQFEVWDRPQPQPTPVPPMQQPPAMNGYGPGPHYGPPPPHLPPQVGGYPPPPPPYAQQANGYHHGPPPPPPSGPPHRAGPHHPGPHPHMHERQHSYGFQHQHSPNAPPPPHYGPPQARGPPPMSGYGPPPPGPHMPNGLPSPHNGPPPPPMHPSASYPHPPPHPHAAMQGGPRPDQNFANNAQLGPMAPPLHSSPNTPFGRPGINGPPPLQPPLPNQQVPQLPAGSPAPPPPSGSGRPPGGDGPPLPPPPHGRPSTPRNNGNGSLNNGTAPAGMSGASASPSLMNLLH